MKTSLIRPRKPDIYDPERFDWIVEFDDASQGTARHVDIFAANEIREWIIRNTSSTTDEFVIWWGRLVGFKNHEDAMLFYLTHA